MIRTLLSLAAIGGLVVASSPVVFAQGASPGSPGQQSASSGTPPANGSPGASGNAPGQSGTPPPGQIYNDLGQTPTGGTPGASGYAPPHLNPVSGHPPP
jgi:hypothetical protein